MNRCWKKQLPIQANMGPQSNDEKMAAIWSLSMSPHRSPVIKMSVPGPGSSFTTGQGQY